MATLELNAENSIIEDLRCFICNRYLVYSPIQVTPDGNTLCGQCSLGNIDAYRVFVIEKILRKLSFPCKNKKYGCLSTSNFDMAENHENTCKFQPFLCPFFKKWNCSFQGIINNFSLHLNTCHKDLIRKDLQFSFDLNCDKEEEFVASISEGKFYFMQYSYNSHTFDLIYSIAQFAYKSEETKFRISNDVNGDRTITLKGGLCISYANNMKKNEFKINVQPLSAMLDSKLFCCTLILESKEQPKKLTIAVATSEPQKVVKRVDDKVEDKCKWKGCKFTTEGKNKKEHERTCSFRVYSCVVQGCKKLFKSGEGEAHLQTHNIVFHQRFSGLNSLTPDEQEYKMCSYVNKEFVLISYTMFDYLLVNNSPMITLKANSSACKGGVSFTFSHTACQKQSKWFYVKWNNVLNIFPDELPPCFYTEQLISFSIFVNANCYY